MADLLYVKRTSFIIQSNLIRSFRFVRHIFSIVRIFCDIAKEGVKIDCLADYACNQEFLTKCTTLFSCLLSGAAISRVMQKLCCFFLVRNGRFNLPFSSSTPNIHPHKIVRHLTVWWFRITMSPRLV